METALKSAAEVAAEIKGTEFVNTENDPRDQLEYSFDFNHTDVRGKTWYGSFTNRILTIYQRQQVGVVKARIQGNLPSVAIDPYTSELNEQIAHLTISLIKTPKWAADLGALYDENIILKLYEEVASHEARFHRLETPKDESEKSEGNGRGESETLAPEKPQGEARDPV